MSVYFLLVELVSWHLHGESFVLHVLCEDESGRGGGDGERKWDGLGDFSWCQLLQKLKNSAQQREQLEKDGRDQPGSPWGCPQI